MQPPTMSNDIDPRLGDGEEEEDCNPLHPRDCCDVCYSGCCEEMAMERKCHILSQCGKCLTCRNLFTDDGDEGGCCGTCSPDSGEFALGLGECIDTCAEGACCEEGACEVDCCGDVCEDGGCCDCNVSEERDLNPT